MPTRSETREFNSDQGGLALCWDIEQQGRGATITVERTEAKGWAVTATIDEDSEAAKFFGELNENGFFGWHSGGGCRAMHKDYGDGFAALLTDEDADFPTRDEWLLGALDFGDNLEAVPFQTYEGGLSMLEAIAAVDAAIQPLADKRKAMLDRRAIITATDKARGDSVYSKPTVREAIDSLFSWHDGCRSDWFTDEDASERIYSDDATRAFDHSHELTIYNEDGDRFTISVDASAFARAPDADASGGVA